jgi:ketosteroid isomerase-like protein
MAGSGGAAEVSRSFARALLDGDAAAAASHLSAEACLLTADGTEVLGRRQALGVLGQITPAEHELEIRVGRSVVSGGVALCTQYWLRRSPPGAPVSHEVATTARLVLAREGERWKIVIAAPWE